MELTVKQRLTLARAMMVMSSLSPLFVLWGIRGTALVPEPYFLFLCVALVTVPTGLVLLRMRRAVLDCDRRELDVGRFDDHRDQVLVCLLAMLLPFYAEDIDNPRLLASSVAGVGFVGVLFYRLNLHYMNLWFVLCGYHVFSIQSTSSSPLAGRLRYSLISRRSTLDPGSTITAYRLSDTVFWERDS